ncbi:MAG: OsmC family protein [Proteobacteria bacterium]|nr:OsmC family protein [Pseudomonadota bacterium]
MAKVTVATSEDADRLIGTAEDFHVSIERGERHAPRSIELVLLGLGSCTLGTIQHYLRRKNLPVDGLSVEVASELDEKENRYGPIKVVLGFSDAISDEQRVVLLGIARTCRIHRTFENMQKVAIELKEAYSLAK